MEQQGGVSAGGIKKKRPPKKRAKGEKSHRQRQDGRTQHDRAGPARHEGPVLPSGEREPGPDRARPL